MVNAVGGMPVKGIKLTYGLVSGLVMAYKDLLLIAVLTFCALCIINYFSTVIFFPGEWTGLPGK
jgi:hypothetical protein